MGNIAAIFSGQGSQVIGMYQTLYDENEIVRETIKEAEQITGINIHEICFKGPISEMMKPQNSHIAIVAFGVAAFRAFISKTGQIPKLCAGHSLGEYTALVCSGALKYSDVLRLVQARCEISQDIMKITDSGMSIIDNLKVSIADSICNEQRKMGKKVYISCYNSNTQVAISGINKILQETEQLIIEQGGKFTPLIDSAPFHCPIMEQGKERLNDILSKININDLRYPILSNWTGKPYTEKEFVKENLLSHLLNPVRWTDIIKYIHDIGITMVIDFSANNIFLNTFNKNEIKTFCFGNRTDRKSLFDMFQVKNNNGSNSSFISKCLCAAVSVQNRNSNLEEYNRCVIESYRRLNQIGKEINKNDNKNIHDITREVIELLYLLLKTKGISEEESDWRIKSIMEECGFYYKYE